MQNLADLKTELDQDNKSLVSTQLQFDKKGVYLLAKSKVPEDSGKISKVYIEDFKKLPYEWDKKELAFMARQKEDSTNFTWIILGATTLAIWFGIVGALIWFF